MLRTRVWFPEKTEIFISVLIVMFCFNTHLGRQAFQSFCLSCSGCKLTNGYFFPLLSSSVSKLYRVNKCSSFSLYSLSLLEPRRQYETVALHLQWRKKKTFGIFGMHQKPSFCCICIKVIYAGIGIYSYQPELRWFSCTDT